MRQKAAVSAGAHAQAWHVISLAKLVFWGASLDLGSPCWGLPIA